MKPSKLDIRVLLDELGCTQKWLSEKLDVSENTVTSWVRVGCPRVVWLYLDLLCRLRRESG